MTIYSLDVLLFLFGTSLLFHEQNLVRQDTGERNSDPTGNLPVGVQESLAKAWVVGGLLQGWGHGLWQYLPGIF